MPELQPLWLTQQNELFNDIDKQCQEVTDAVIPAVDMLDEFAKSAPEDLVGAFRAAAVAARPV